MYLLIQRKIIFWPAKTVTLLVLYEEYYSEPKSWVQPGMTCVVVLTACELNETS